MYGMHSDQRAGMAVGSRVGRATIQVDPNRAPRRRLGAVQGGTWNRWTMRRRVPRVMLRVGQFGVPKKKSGRFGGNRMTPGWDQDQDLPKRACDGSGHQGPAC